MSYQHIHHPPQPQGFGGPFPPAGFPYDAPPLPPPPPPRHGPGYQDYFADQGYSQPPPPPVYEHTHHYHHGDDFRGRCWSLWRGCCAALCCCCVLEECCS